MCDHFSGVDFTAGGPYRLPPSPHHGRSHWQSQMLTAATETASASSDLPIARPSFREGSTGPVETRDLLDLAPGGVCRVSPSGFRRRLVSVALSVESLRQVVSLHPALWCPDFPHPTFVKARSPGPLSQLFKDHHRLSIAKLDNRSASLFISRRTC